MEKIIVNKDLCIGCGTCVGNSSKYFEFDDEGLSKVKTEILEPEDKMEVLESVESCPTEAIIIEDEK